jgi:hypothetical protein
MKKKSKPPSPNRTKSGAAEDEKVPLFYGGGSPRWICAVARRENGEGFLITAYRTDVVKAGDQIWKKSK